VLFGLDQLAALAVTAVVAAGLSLAARPHPDGTTARAIRTGLGSILALAILTSLARDAIGGSISPWDFVPLNLCDFAIVVAAFGLFTRRQAAYELLFFWALSGTLLAMITPDLTRGFPSRQFISFYAFHGSVVIAALFLTLGLRMAPRRGAPWRVFLWTNLYAAVAGTVDFFFHRNFLYLREKPQARSALDWMGPWPVYILGAEALALALFLLLNLPFALQRRVAEGPSVPRLTPPAG
jgi:hypothetical integral membrane protein (TIGR02206 family)